MTDRQVIGTVIRRRWLAPGIGPETFRAAMAYNFALLAPLLEVPVASLPAGAPADDCDCLAAEEEAVRRLLGGPDHAPPWAALWATRDGAAPAAATPEWIGHHVLGPVLAAWADHVAAALTHAPDLHALALHRDGAVLGEAVRRHTPALAGRIGEAWLSRRGSATAAVADAHDREGLANLLIRMRHRPATAAEAAADLGLHRPAEAPDTPLIGDAFERFCDQVAAPALSAKLEHHVGEARRTLLAHLDNSGLPKGVPLMLLDVGYAATVQRCLTRVLARAGRKQVVHGLYFATSPGALWAMAEGGSVTGVFGMLGAPEPFGPTFLRHRDVVECLLAQPEGELQGYDAAGRPRCAPSDLPAGQIAAAARLQSAALNFVDHWARQPPLPLEDSAALARVILTRLFLRPLPNEVAVLANWLHADSTALGVPRRLAEGPSVADASREQTLWPAAATAKAGQ
ncbi:MAG: hypothetical protein ACM31D_03985 [Bacteroidota bacterium]